MTAAEFSIALAYLGLSNADAADLLQVTPHTIRHWIKGRYVVPEGVERQLEEMVAETDVEVAVLVAKLAGGKVDELTVFGDSAAARAAHPDWSRPWSAGWHQLVVARAVRQAPWSVRVVYSNG
ncbi:hypothetical protein [Nocardia rhizosphaerae]|uniref:Uncharacterized protein n=1 Tax=Nocardia rhizosphaerae TaxID=1691571 RepID=A0ABV8LDP5_9NOCA